MSLLAVGSAMVIVASAATQWRSPRILVPLLRIGQRSYEVYLTHMFVVFVIFGIFVSLGSPLHAVPVLFLAVIIVAGLSGRSGSEILLRANEPNAAQALGRWAGKARLGY